MDVKRTTTNVIYDQGVDYILMIRKRRNSHGFGDKGYLWKDKYNFPGGKVELNENFTEGVIRETKEETGVVPLNIDMRGLINFKGLDFIIQNAVFLTTDYDGSILNETEEASVEWIKRTQLPFDKMFPSDKLWVPEIWKPKYFMGEVINTVNDNKMEQKLNYIKKYNKMSDILKQRGR